MLSLPTRDVHQERRTNPERAPRIASIAVSNDRCDLVPTELLDCTTRGAKVVLQSQASPGHRVDFVLTLERTELVGFARVAWTQRLSNGKVLAGLEFVDFEMTCRVA